MTRHRHGFGVRACLASLLLCSTAWGASVPREVILIGGPKSHGPGEHDYANGARVLEALISQSSSAADIRVVSFPEGWPAKEDLLDGAATLVLYYDGAQMSPDEQPLSNAAHRAEFEKLMSKGTGVVALHQASTVGADDKTVNLGRFLGGARYGTYDRTTETVKFQPAHHAVNSGLKDFDLTDEFYPTIRFSGQPVVTPLLVANVHPQFSQGKALVIDKAESHPVAWSVERPDHGRAVTFTGLHFLTNLDDPSMRTFVLNAVYWTAHMEVPPQGVQTKAVPDLAKKVLDQEMQLEGQTQRTLTEATVVPASKAQVLPQPWGQLTWYVSRELKSSDTMTIGQAIVNVGQENPRHYHPNCDEVLHVIKGHILHSMGDRTMEMNDGDTVSIPAGVHHNAKNLGKEPAILAISFSSADRIAVGE